MDGNDAAPRRPWHAVIRRLLFLTVLLSLGSVTTTCFDFGYNQSRTPTAIVFATFMWGADSIGIVLAAWMAGRTSIWRSWSGGVRVVAYLSAYIYGRMLFSATQDWDERTPFRLPGAVWEDYSRPAIDLLSVLMFTWLLFPAFALCRGMLVAKDETLRLQPRPVSIALLFGWTTLAAVILLWIRFLSWEGVAPPTAFDSMSAAQLLKKFLTVNLPGNVVICAAAMIMIVAWPRKWWIPVLAFALAVVVDFNGQSVVERLTGDSNMVTGGAVKRWSYAAGRSFIVWAAFAAAYFSGVSFQRSSGCRPRVGVSVH